MAKRKKHVEVSRFKIECPRCNKTCAAAVKRHTKTVMVSFECHGCGYSDDVPFRGEDAEKFR